MHPALATEPRMGEPAVGAAAANPGVVDFSLRDGVAVAYRSILDRAVRRFRARLASTFGGRVPSWLDVESLAQAWADALLSRLTSLSLRSLVLELNVARLRGELSGDDPSARFRSFFDLLARPRKLQAFFGEYAVLKRKVGHESDTSCCAVLEALRHLQEDAPRITARLGIELSRERLLSLRAHRGADRHNGGRAVLEAVFASGRRLLYKPRPSGVDVHFEQLLGWISARDASFQFRVPAAVAAREHGWSEHISHRPCTSDRDASIFYRREGEYLALLYALGACDFHFENLIADGPWPVLVDLESLFHPPLVFAKASTAAEQAGVALLQTVLRVGLLPWRVSPLGQAGGSDIGGISAPTFQMTPAPVLTAEEAGTDRMRLVRKPVPVGAQAHRVVLPDGSMPPVLAHAGAVTAGFDRMYAFLLEHRESLLAADGPLAVFARDDVRVLIRSTSVYATLLQEGSHPDALRDEQQHRSLLARLCLDATDVAPRLIPPLQQVVDAEQADLAAGDVPIFWTRVDGTELRDTQGRRISNLLPQSAYDALHERLRSLGKADHALQDWVIKTSLATLASHVHAGEAAFTPHTAASTARPGPRSLRAAALRKANEIGRRLGELAYRSDGDATWLGVNVGSQSQCDLGVVHDDLYSGVPGIVLFLAYLGHVSGSAEPRSLAQDAAAGWRRRLEASNNGNSAGLGAFSGIGGALYILTHLGRLWRDAALLDQAEDLVGPLKSKLAEDRQFDVIGGAAGSIAALLALNAVTKSSAAMDAAMACGDHLLANAVPQATGWAWPSGAAGDVPLGGFSHGAAGIGWALSRLARSSGQSRFDAAARLAFAYDGGLLDADSGSWRDLRPDAAVDREGPAYDRWCHGGPGIALGRLDSLPLHDDSDMRRDLAAALRSTLRNGAGANHCLCHGDLGNLETLLQAKRRLSAGAGWGRRVEQSLTTILGSIDANGWRCGIPLRAESPGLMTGLAGIGYGLLRAALPHTVPSVLLLEPPHAAMS